MTAQHTHPVTADERFHVIQTVIESMQQEVFEINDANGWYEDKRSFGEDVALLHTEVSEMFEAYRDARCEDQTEQKCDKPFHGEEGHLCKPEGVGSEAADILIRLLDTCRRAEVDLAFEYRRKSAFNRTRGYKHGGKII